MLCNHWSPKEFPTTAHDESAELVNFEIMIKQLLEFSKVLVAQITLHSVIRLNQFDLPLLLLLIVFFPHGSDALLQPGLDTPFFGWTFVQTTICKTQVLLLLKSYLYRSLQSDPAMFSSLRVHFFDLFR